MRRKAVMAASVMAAVLVGHSAHGQQPVVDPFAPRPIAEGRSKGVIASAEYVDTPVTTVFRMISDLTGWSIVMSPEISRQPPRVNIWIKDLRPDQVLQEIAALAGLVVERDGNTIKISSFDEYARCNGLEKKVVPLKYSSPKEVAQILSAFAGKDDRACIQPDETGRKVVLLVPKPLMDSFVKLIHEIDVPTEQDKIEIIPLRHRDVTQVETVVTAFLSRSGVIGGASPKTPATVLPREPDQVYVVAEPRLNVLLLRGPAETVARAKSLVEELDKPLDVQVVPYQLKYTTAKEVYDTLMAILSSEDQQAVRGRYRRLRVGLSEQNNQIIVEAPQAEQTRAAKLIEAIDRPLPPGSGGTRVYRLENASSAEVLKVLVDLIEDRSRRAVVASDASRPGQEGVHRVGSAVPAASISSPRPQADAAPAAAGAAAEASKQTNILPAKVTEAPEINAVVIRASAAEHEEFAALIKELDLPRDQVMLEVTVVTVRSSKGFELGVELGGAKLNGEGVQTIGFANFGIGAVDSATGRIRLAAEAPLGLNYALFNSGDFSLVLKALETVGRTRIAASPKILVEDNALAMISQVDEEPFEVVSQGDTSTTTTFGGFVEAGTTLTVIPHLSRANWLRLQYKINSSSFGTREDPNLPPPRLRREVDGVVRVPADYMVALGGLVSTRDENRQAAVPFVSQIPLLGELFKERSFGSTNETLFVFVRPVALRDPAFRDLVHLSREDVEKAKLVQKDYPSNPLKLLPSGLLTTTQPTPEESK